MNNYREFSKDVVVNIKITFSDHHSFTDNLLRNYIYCNTLARYIYIYIYIFQLILITIVQ